MLHCKCNSWFIHLNEIFMIQNDWISLFLISGIYSIYNTATYGFVKHFIPTRQPWAARSAPSVIYFIYVSFVQLILLLSPNISASQLHVFPVHYVASWKGKRCLLDCNGCLLIRFLITGICYSNTWLGSMCMLWKYTCT